MTSVNKIKELANSREYSLALELVEHQDLTKSLNPQFLRLCGEIYIKNNRYADARRCLLMAHRLAPESKRIIYTFVELYLRMGYFRLAKTYYDMYMFDASAYDSREIEYIWNKHEHPEEYGSLDVLLDGYMHNLDYEWSFELYLLYKKEGKQKEADTLAELYHASYQNSENSQIIADIESGKTTVDAYFDVYAAEEQPDDDPDLESLRMEEKELLEADDLRMHPKEAEITVMYEDSYTPAGSEKKVQKMLKKQEREEQRKEKKLQKKLKQQEKAEAENAAAEISTEEENVSAVTESNTEEETTTVGIEAKTEKDSTTTVAGSGMEVNETATEEKQQNDETEKKLTEPEQMGTEEKKDNEDVQAKAVKTENTQNSEKQPEEEKEAAFDEFWNAEDDETEKTKERKSFFDKFRRKKKSARGETEDIEKRETEQEDGQKDTSEKIETADEENTAEQKEVKNTEDTTSEIKSEESNIESSSENIETTGQADDMIHRKNIISKDVVVVDEDDGFEAEAETVEELEAQEQSKIKNASLDTATTVSKPAFEFQMVDLAPEDFDDEYQVDDFSEKIDEEFGEMKTVEAEKPFDIGELIPEKPKSDKVEETVEAVEENEETVEEVEEPAVEETVETVEEVEEPAVEETEETVEEVEEPAAEETEETVEEVEEPVVEETVEEVEEPEAEETEEIMEAVEETEETVEEVEEPAVEEIEETVEEVEEPEAEETEEIMEAVEETEETVEEVEEPVVEETKETVEEVEESAVEETVEEVEEPAAEETEETVEEVEELVVEETEETVEEVEKAEVEKPEMEEAEEKTEFRVAPFTTKPEKKKLDFPVFKSSLFPDYHKETKVVENNFNEIMEEARDKITENMRKEEQMQREAEALLATLGISMDSIPATPKTAEKEEQPVQKGPSRDELKASLKIDTVKKNLLKHVKEYR
ncbi:tetratricopeptide repeat protein [Eubacterium sp. MSJ-33]|uniref:tetratricopeptide repeat protein n=1 Tax=Eubacterium sp. MSJ-33 TaxID=2841528 RepID=UPI001C7593C9|nr:hypothetical protein [Eubacterium sp. MSJ-33]QWT53873.1 hypothetical protein KP625_04450 [Eubacterium sp. MSJ-33]